MTNLKEKANFKKMTNLKVMSYNILDGFDWGNDMERKEKLLAWVKEQTPDVIALQELCAYTPEKLAADAKTWRHEYSILLKEDGYSVGLTSNTPIELKERVINELHHGMLHCETFGVDFFVVHLSPHHYHRRYQEAQLISEKVKSCGNDKYIILGDFNSLSTFDAELLKENTTLQKTVKIFCGRNSKLFYCQFEY